MRRLPSPGRAMLYKLLFAIGVSSFILYIWMHDVHIR